MTSQNGSPILYVQSGTRNAVQQCGEPRSLQRTAGEVDWDQESSDLRSQWLHGLYQARGRNRVRRTGRVLREQQGRSPEGIAANELGGHQALRRFAALTALVSVAVLAGCAATTGVVATGPDTYMVSHRDNGPASSLGALKAAAYKDAAAFCSTKGKSLKVLSSTDVPRSFGQFPETEVLFRCD